VLRRRAVAILLVAAILGAVAIQLIGWTIMVLAVALLGLGSYALAAL
jgi:hypothetical protein